MDSVTHLHIQILTDYFAWIRYWPIMYVVIENLEQLIFGAESAAGHFHHDAYL